MARLLTRTWVVRHIVVRYPWSSEYWKVMREDASEVLCNDRNRTKRFRKEANAIAACAKLNDADGVDSPDGEQR
jgi:hypothetical protein